MGVGPRSGIERGVMRLVRTVWCKENERKGKC